MSLSQSNMLLIINVHTNYKKKIVHVYKATANSGERRGKNSISLIDEMEEAQNTEKYKRNHQ